MRTATEVKLRQAEWATRNAPKFAKLATSLEKSFVEPLHKVVAALLAPEAGRVKAAQSDD